MDLHLVHRSDAKLGGARDLVRAQLHLPVADRPKRLAVVVHLQREGAGASCALDHELVGELARPGSRAAPTRRLFADKPRLRELAVRCREDIPPHVLVAKLDAGVQALDRHRRFEPLDQQSVDIPTNMCAALEGHGLPMNDDRWQVCRGVERRGASADCHQAPLIVGCTRTGRGRGRVAQPFGFRPHRSERAAFPHSALPEGYPRRTKDPSRG
jgi:hypothetical protein